MVSLQNKRKYKRMSTLQGKLRRRSKGGQFSYRLIIASGLRKEFALGTTDPKVACQKAEELDSIWLAPTPDVALAQMNAIRGFSRSSMKLPFAETMRTFRKGLLHRSRTKPPTVRETARPRMHPQARSRSNISSTSHDSTESPPIRSKPSSTSPRSKALPKRSAAVQSTSSAERRRDHGTRN